MPRFFLKLLLLFLLAAPLQAMEAGERLPDPLQEKRAMALGDQLRCMVCQSESINDSPADLAKDLRQIVREKIKAGMDDAAILNYLHARYGDYVLLKPPLNQETAALWLAPWLFLGIGFTSFILLLLRNKKWHKD